MLVTGQPDLNKRHHEIEQHEPDQRADDLQDELEGTEDHGEQRASASRSRTKVLSRPRSSSDSNSGGPTRGPGTAQRNGACALRSTRPTASPISIVASCSAGAFHSSSPKRSIATASRVCAVGSLRTVLRSEERRVGK